MNFFEELKRRNVVRVAIAYGITAWLLAQVADLVFDNFVAPPWVMQSFLVLLLLGFPLALFLAWAFELTPDGIKRDADARPASSAESASRSRKLDRAIIAILSLAVVFLLYRQLWAPAPDIEPGAAIVEPDMASSSPGGKPEDPATPPAKSVAVLPFVAMSSGENDEYFADGLTEEILNALAQLQGLRVTARTSSFHFKGQDLPVPQIAEQLGVANIVEGSVRRSGDQVRVTAQLVRANDGFHLWSDSYDGSVSDGFDMQTRIAENVALALDVVLDETRRQRMRVAGIRDPEAFILLQKGVDLYHDAHGSASFDQLRTLERANDYFEQVMQLAPTNPEPYVLHVDYYIHIALEYAETGEMPPETDLTLDAVRKLAQQDLDAAVTHSRDEMRRAENELTRVVFSDSWRGLSSIIRSAIGTENCFDPNWSHIVSAPFGMADLLLADSRRVVDCDPLNPDGYVHTAGAAIWLGEFQQAAALGAEAVEKVNNEWLVQMFVTALIGSGDLERARRVIATHFRSEGWTVAVRELLAAHEGDADAARQHFQRLEEIMGETDSGRLIHHARLGEREPAQRRAGEIDARAFGPMKLAQAVYLCMCGAPFDLEATPNFAKKLEEAGLPWPPPDTIEFPLKTW
ncbi:MAG: hypothetical protein R3348_02320 [Xanthomonadales bacterium]|nr:hypothetical protein [Xanthomonadales bacterium]